MLAVSSARVCAWPSAAQCTEQHHERGGDNCPEGRRDIKSGISKRETMNHDPHGTHVLPDEFRMKLRYPTKVLLRIQFLPKPTYQQFKPSNEFQGAPSLTQCDLF